MYFYLSTFTVILDGSTTAVVPAISDKCRYLGIPICKDNNMYILGIPIPSNEQGRQHCTYTLLSIQQKYEETKLKYSSTCHFPLYL